MKRLDKEMAEAARRAAEEALAEGDITVMPDEEEFIVFKGERILLKRLKTLMVYHSITTVILHFNFMMIRRVLCDPAFRTTTCLSCRSKRLGCKPTIRK